MKLYRIGEISQLYGISVDTLRHYEKMGILMPEQVNDSGYRYYSNRQIWQLNIIRTLRQLGIGLLDIRDYMIHRTLDKSQALVEFQLDTIDQKLRELNRLKQELEDRHYYFQESQQVKVGEIKLKTLPTRKVWIEMREVRTIWEIDRLHKEIELNIEESRLSYFAWGRAGAFISEGDFHKGNHAHYSGTFIIDKLADKTLPAGDYLCMHFQGEYSQQNIDSQYLRMKDYMKNHSLELTGPVVEIYKLDIHETDDQQEYLTEIQIPVSFHNQADELNLKN